jgi:hypothetical protein
LFVIPDIVSKQFSNFMPLRLIGASSIFAKATPSAVNIDFIIESPPASEVLSLALKVRLISILDKIS